MPLTKFKFEREFKGHHFTASWHYGSKNLGVEVLKVTPEPWVEKDYKNYTPVAYEFFDTVNEVFDYLATFGYHNVGRFIMGD